jgi:flagellar protein FlgJ
MASAPTTPADFAAITALAKSNPKVADRIAKTRSVAEEFEAVFLNTMFQQMFANIGQGPFGGGPAAGIWRSFLTDEYAKSFVKAGGIGIADQLQRELLAQQELR